MSDNQESIEFFRYGDFRCMLFKNIGIRIGGVNIERISSPATSKLEGRCACICTDGEVPRKCIYFTELLMEKYINSENNYEDK